MTELQILFERDLNKLKSEIEQYPTDESLWIIKDGISNSGGNLCAHLCGNLRHFVGKNIGDDGYVRDREREFSVKGLSRQELIAEIDNTIDAVTRVLQNISESDLDASYPDRIPIPDTNTRHVLLHLYAHLSYHLGQINYHRRLLT